MLNLAGARASLRHTELIQSKSLDLELHCVKSCTTPGSTSEPPETCKQSTLAALGATCLWVGTPHQDMDNDSTSGMLV